MKILAVETSCDDTGVAILEIKGSAKKPKFCVLSNVVASQIEIHKQYGGVYPFMAKREHQKNLVPTLEKALKESRLLFRHCEEANKPTKQSQRLRLPRSPADSLAMTKLNKILERETELKDKLISFLQKYEKPDVDLIAVTNGPGLEPCLWVGVNFARALSFFWDIPVVATNHIESHILVNFLPSNVIARSDPERSEGERRGNPESTAQTLDSRFRGNDKREGGNDSGIKFPAITLVVSGGHTQLILVKGIGKYKILGETRDDAAGECFDKCAKILGLGYPGGPEIARLASSVIPGLSLHYFGEDLTRNPELAARTLDSRFPPRLGEAGRGNDISLPRPMINDKNYDFSFSGLKTAVLYTWNNKQNNSGSVFAVRKKRYHSKSEKSAMAAEIQQAIIDVLIKKTMKATKDFGAKTIILGGGVSANQELRKQFQSVLKNQNVLKKEDKSEIQINLLFPLANLSTDNALMTAVTGYFHRNKKASWRALEANANLRIG